VAGKAPGGTALTVSYLGVDASTDITVTAEVLSYLEIYPGQASIWVGADSPLTATAVFSNGTTWDFTDQVTWTSSNTGIATVGNTILTQGLLMALSPGNSTISAHYEGITATTVITVTAATLQSIEVNPNNSSIALGTNQHFIAIGNFSDGSIQDTSSQVAWQSSQTGVVNTPDGGGEFLSYTAGSSQISAGLNDIYGFTTLTVTSAILNSITLLPTNTTAAKGTFISFYATGHYSDLSSQDITELVTWSSSAPDNAVISNQNGNKGKATMLQQGAATITAVLNSVSNNTGLTVTAAQLESISIQATNSQMDAGTTQQLAATGHYSDDGTQDITDAVTWVSANTNALTISNAGSSKGMSTAHSVGMTTISASLNSFSGTIDITVVENPNEPKSISGQVSPNVILNDGDDVTTISFTVQPNSPTGVIADNTPVELEITEGGVVTNPTIFTTSGIASYLLTSNYDGLITVSATLLGTTISNTVVIESRPGFASLMTKIQYMTPQYSSGVYLEGSKFGLIILNNSNRTFTIDEHRFSNNGVPINTLPGSYFDDGLMGPGEAVSIVIVLAFDLPDNGVGSTFVLSDPATGQQFSVGGTYLIQ